MRSACNCLQLKASEVDFSSTEDVRDAKSRASATGGFATDTDISRGHGKLIGRELVAVDNSWLTEGTGTCHFPFLVMSLGGAGCSRCV